MCIDMQCFDSCTCMSWCAPCQWLLRSCVYVSVFIRRGSQHVWCISVRPYDVLSTCKSNDYTSILFYFIFAFFLLLFIHKKCVYLEWFKQIFVLSPYGEKKTSPSSTLLRRSSSNYVRTIASRHTAVRACKCMCAFLSFVHETVDHNVVNSFSSSLCIH